LALEQTLREQHIRPTQIRWAAQDVVEKFRREWGGTNVYIPRVFSAERAARNRAIAGRWTEDNAHELMRDFDVSEATVRRAVAAGRRQARTGNRSPRR